MNKKILCALLCMILIAPASFVSGDITNNLFGKKTSEEISIDIINNVESSASYDDVWSMYRHDPVHSGYSSCDTLETNDTWWIDDIGGKVASPTVSNGKVYFCGDNWKVYCFNAETGEWIWEYTAGGRLVSKPIVYDERVFITSINEGKVYCLDTESGEHIWEYQTDDNIWKSPAVANGRVYVGSSDNKLYCLDTVTGEEVWTYTAHGPVRCTPEIAYGNVYFGCHGINNCDYGYLYCLNATTSQFIWSYYWNDHVYASPAAAYGYIYAGFGGFLKCFDAQNGDIIWTQNDMGCNDVKVAIMDGKIFAQGFDYQIIKCLDAYSGDVDWDYRGRVDDRISAKNGKVFFREGDELFNKYLTCLFAENGTVKWKYQTPESGNTGNVRSYPCIENGKVYVGICETFFCLDEHSGEKLWLYIAGASFGRSSPAANEERIYIGNGEHWVDCIDLFRGKRVWRYRLGGAIESSPALYYSRLFVGSNDYNMYCLNLNEFGEKVWNYTTNGAVQSSPTFSDEKIYFGSNDYNLYCLDWYSGAYEWSYPTNGAVISSPAIMNEKVYFGSNDQSIYCLDKNDGSFIWQYPTGGAVVSSPSISNGNVYVGSDDGHVYCLDADTGDLEWNHLTGGPVQSSPAVAYGIVYVGSNDHHIYGLDADTGDLEWNHLTGGPVQSSPAVADGNVYVGSDDGKMYCCNATTGFKMWEYRTDGAIQSSPAITADTVFFASNDKRMYANGFLNHAPEPPHLSDMFWPEYGEPGEVYYIKIWTYDFENDLLHYYVDWGDGTNSGWLGPYETLEWVYISNIWNEPGTYTIRAKAKDPYEFESDWSNTLEFTIIESDPPTAPNIEGPPRGNVDEEYEYTFASTDPDDDEVWYYIDWGDDQIEEWIGPYSSGEEVIVSHTWERRGTYTIRAKAKDSYNIESEWGTLVVIMPKNHHLTHSLFMWLLDRFPRIFPILRYFLELTS